MGAASTVKKLLPLLLFPSLLFAAQVPPDKETFTTGILTFPVGTTTSPQFSISDKNTGVYTVAFPCAVSMVIISLNRSFDGGKTWENAGRYSRNAVPCKTATIILAFTVPQMPPGTKFQGTVENFNIPIKGALTVTLDKTP